MRHKAPRLEPGISPSSTTAPSFSSPLPDSLADTSQLLPKLIVFDLDYTLWPFWVDTHITPPLTPNAQHTAATDRYGETCAFYLEVPSILQGLPRRDVRLAVASRTCAPSLARELIKMLHLPTAEGDCWPRKALEAFDGGLEIYPGSKIQHMEALHKRTGIQYEDVLFFDDERRNMETEKLGVTMWLVHDGMTWNEVERGLEEWRRRRREYERKN